MLTTYFYLSLGGVAVYEQIPIPHCSSCPRTLFLSVLIINTRVWAFVSPLSEANVSQDVYNTWDLFSQLEVTVHELCCGHSRGSLGKRLPFCYVFTLLSGSQAVMLQSCHCSTFSVLKVGSSHLGAQGTWYLKFPLNWSSVLTQGETSSTNHHSLWGYFLPFQRLCKNLLVLICSSV